MAELSFLLSPWLEDLALDTEVSDITLDSRQVEANALFIAVIGHQVDGRNFIDKAIEKGASAVLQETLQAEQHGAICYVSGRPLISFYQLGTILSALANRFYALPASHFPLLGITGTNGKTTISQLIAQWKNLLGGNAGVMGTTGNGLLHNLTASENTTGSAIDVVKDLHNLAQQGADLVAMEISSHGLVQHRVRDLEFEVGIFTNLSRDHLDYHKSMHNYAQAKKLLFTEHKTQHSVLNIDDAIGREFALEIDNSVGVALDKKNLTATTDKQLWAEELHFTNQGLGIRFDSSWGRGELHVSLIGDFNASNVLLAFAVMLTLGYPMADLIRTAPKLRAVIGRMEVFSHPSKPMGVVDYAHTPDALEKALLALKRHCQGELWCVFGCGGDRDKGKRALMAEVATRLAQHTVLTNDNPRTESATEIMHDIEQGVVDGAQYCIELDRKKACELALSRASEHDIVLIAGKGHEDYQILGTHKIHYSDRETLQHWMGESA